MLLDKRLFRRVLDIVIKDTEIYENNLPKENPFTAKEILNNEFFPDG